MFPVGAAAVGNRQQLTAQRQHFGDDASLSLRYSIPGDIIIRGDFPLIRLSELITTQRSFAAVGLPLQEVKAIGKAHGGTLNDAVLWLVSTALRSHYEAKGELPKKSMVAAVPVFESCIPPPTTRRR